MLVQQGIFFEENQKRIGNNLKVLVESKENSYFVGRSQAEAPEVDNVIFIKDKNINIGDFVKVKIVDSRAYDLVAEVKR